MRQLYEYHPVVGYRYIPGLRARVPHEGGGYLMEVNAHGFRSDRPFIPERTAGNRRILVFGDSFTAGDGVPNRQRYTDLLEEHLVGSDAPAEVYNFGLSSTGTDQQYLIWQQFAQVIDHDLVVIAVFVENIRRVAAHFRPHHDEHGRERIYAKPYYTIMDGALRLCHVPPRREPFDAHELSAIPGAVVDQGGRFPTVRKVVTALGMREIVQRLSSYQPLPQYDSPADPAWQLMRAILAQWIAEIDKPIVLMPIPLPQHLDMTADPGGYQTRFAELADELGCYLHDPLPDLLAIDAAKRRQLRWPKDIHFTPAGHLALMQSLAPAIEHILVHTPQPTVTPSGENV